MTPKREPSLLLIGTILLILIIISIISISGFVIADYYHDHRYERCVEYVAHIDWLKNNPLP